MTKLSINEVTYLRNPEKFNDTDKHKNHRYVLTHRIKKKRDSMRDTLNFITKHERALLTDKERKQYDERKALEYHMEERLKINGITVFTPNVQQRAKAIQDNIYKLDRVIGSFKAAINNTPLTPAVKQQSKAFVKNLKSIVDNQFAELDAIFKDDDSLLSD